MSQQPLSFSSMVKQTTAFVPVAMSLMALALVLGAVAMYGTGRSPDEGTVAHLWQLLMVGQVPVVAFFAIRWLPRSPVQGLGVLALQVGAGLASMAPVYFLHL